MVVTNQEAASRSMTNSQVTTARAAVALKRVSKTYRSGAIDVPALKDVTLDVPFHRFSTLIGASGSGKTTLLNLVGCIDTPTSGTMEVCGQPIADLSADEMAGFRARNIGFIFQSFSLVPVLSAYENVEYPLLLVGVKANERRKRTLEMLAAVGLAEHAERRPNELSGGQKQRVAIARALVKKPQLVLADEPTANLDSATGAAILELMRRVQAESRTTFIFASHDPQLIAHADDIFCIRDGNVVEHRTGDVQ